MFTAVLIALVIGLVSVGLLLIALLATRYLSDHVRCAMLDKVVPVALSLVVFVATCIVFDTVLAVS